MKPIFIGVLIMLCISRVEAVQEYKDNLLPDISEEKTMEDILIDAFIALPQDYFESTLRKRVLAVHHHAKNDTITIDVAKKTVFLRGDGGQGSVLMTLIKWSKNEVLVRVDYELEDDKTSEVLVRINGGWKVKPVKSIKPDKALQGNSLRSPESKI